MITILIVQKLFLPALIAKSKNGIVHSTLIVSITPEIIQMKTVYNMLYDCKPNYPHLLYEIGNDHSIFMR